jgi:hypothetical protein
MEDREIWFERWLWSYMPCHWKGWALIAAFVVVVGGVIAVLNWVVAALGHPDWSWVEFAPAALGWLWLLAITERHTAKRN